jgi:hypothetical protein
MQNWELFKQKYWAFLLTSRCSLGTTHLTVLAAGPAEGKAGEETVIIAAL